MLTCRNYGDQCVNKSGFNAGEHLFNSYKTYLASYGLILCSSDEMVSEKICDKVNLRVIPMSKLLGDV